MQNDYDSDDCYVPVEYEWILRLSGGVSSDPPEDGIFIIHKQLKFRK